MALSSLNPQQRAAVKELERPLLVLAGAGSGKTSVITQKIAYLVEKGGVPARHIAAVTFTNKAAREMKERVGKLLDDKQSRGLTVSTFHSLGLDIIRREYKTLGYKSGFSIFDEHDRMTLLKELLKHCDYPIDPDQADKYSWRIGGWKNAFVSPEQAMATAEAEIQPAARLYADYTKQLKAYNAVDFDDLILLPVQLFQGDADVLAKWQNKIRYLLVDEYQDTNMTQYQLVRLLTGNLGRFTVVGDDDQSIYAWRGAQPENMAQLQKDYPRLEVIKLEQNYRSSARILKSANHLIANNPHVFEKRLWSDLGIGEPLRVLSHKDEIAEAQQVSSDIVHHRFKSGGRYQDYAILYRSNHQSRLFERSLREHNIPYQISGSRSFFSYTEVKDILAYLRLFANPDDDCAFLRIVNTPRRELGPTTLEKLGTYANQRHVSLFTASFEFGLEQHLAEPAVRRLRRFCEWIVDAADRARRGDTFAVIREFIVSMDYDRWIKDNSSNDKAAQRRQQNVEELITWMERLGKGDGGEPALSLDEVISKILLMDILERNQEEEVQDQVSLMTLHAAKGLEFPHVYLIGMEENILPHQNSVDDGNVEEERRLAYVGITRAKKTLTFSYCRRRKKYGELVECEPSRFLAELPEGELEWRDRKEIDPEEKRERGRASLSQLRELLSND